MLTAKAKEMRHGGGDIRVLLDYTRGTRGKTNSRNMLENAMHANPEGVQVSVFNSFCLPVYRYRS